MGRARVILADDHADFLAAAAEHLEPEFEVIQTVSDGQAAVEAATRLQPDLLVLDIGLPALNGIEAARQLRADGSHAKIVFLTVHDDGDYVRRPSRQRPGLRRQTPPGLRPEIRPCETPWPAAHSCHPASPIGETRQAETIPSSPRLFFVPPPRAPRPDFCPLPSFRM